MYWEKMIKKVHLGVRPVVPSTGAGLWQYHQFEHHV